MVRVILPTILRRYFGPNNDLVVSEIPHREGIYDTIKDFLGKGR